MMQQPADQIGELIAQLGYIEGAIVLLGMDWLGWGQTLIFNCDLRNEGETHAFTWRFVDCRETRWQHYAHSDATEAFPATELVNLRIGQGQHRKPAQLLTAHFGLSVSYREMRLD